MFFSYKLNQKYINFSFQELSTTILISTQIRVFKALKLLPSTTQFMQTIKRKDISDLMKNFSKNQTLR